MLPVVTDFALTVTENCKVSVSVREISTALLAGTLLINESVALCASAAMQSIHIDMKMDNALAFTISMTISS